MVVSRAFQTVVNDHIRLILSNHFDQLGGFPFFSGHIVIGKIEPQKIQLTIPGYKFLYLTMHIFQISVKIDFLIFICRIISHRMLSVSILWKIRMMPVNNGKIQSHLQSSLTARLYKFLYQVSSCFCVRRLVVCQSGIKQTESVMMLCLSLIHI